MLRLCNQRQGAPTSLVEIDEQTLPAKKATREMLP
jgi:hypothetical protein